MLFPHSYPTLDSKPLRAVIISFYNLYFLKHELGLGSNTTQITIWKTDSIRGQGSVTPGLKGNVACMMYEIFSL